MCYLEDNEWTFEEVHEASALPPAIELPNSGSIAPEAKIAYSKATRVTMDKWYLACLARLSEVSHCDALRRNNVRSIEHFASDTIYKALATCAASDLALDMFNFQEECCLVRGHPRLHDHTHLAILDRPPRRPPGVHQRKRARRMLQIESFHWGKVSFLYKKPSGRGKASMQVICHRRSHKYRVEGGGVTECSLTLSYRGIVEQLSVIHRLNAWVLAGLDCVDGDAHGSIDPRSLDLPPLGDLDAACPSADLPDTDVDLTTRPRRRKQRGTAKGRGAGRGRGRRQPSPAPSLVAPAPSVEDPPPSPGDTKDSAEDSTDSSSSSSGSSSSSSS